MTNFAIRGSPDGAGVPIFPTYGANSSLQVLGIEGKGRSQVVDPTANERCAWWARGEYL